MGCELVTDEDDDGLFAFALQILGVIQLAGLHRLVLIDGVPERGIEEFPVGVDELAYLADDIGIGDVDPDQLLIGMMTLRASSRW